MKRILINELAECVGKKVMVSGWVNARRDHGGLIFLDIRDHTGIIQTVVQPDNKDSFALAEQLRDEYVVSISGVVRERGDDLKNPNIETGDIEIEIDRIELLNKSEPLPIPIHDGSQVHEDQRLKYRYLDLRRNKMQSMLKKRAEYYKIMRDYMESENFIEVATPLLANSSPEGARDFLVPSRLRPGEFYALPQAPQQFKQLLMVGGVPRYYQIATCFRDEDPRADRLYGEFYQLDLEMSFVEDGEKVRQTVEPLIKNLVTEFAGKKLLTEKIPRIAHREAMDKYGSDKPDLRYGMELVDLSSEMKDTNFSVFSKAIKDGGVVKAIRVEGGSELTRSQIDSFTEVAKHEGAGGLAYIVYEKDGVKSPIAKFLSEDELEAIRKKMGAKTGDTVFFAADKRDIVNKVLGRLRIEFADHFNLKDPNIISLAWIVDFPFYEWDDKAKGIEFGHNPFSMPKGGMEALENEDKLEIMADQYDMVMNGYEICSGAVRNHNPEIMYKAFGVLGYGKEYVDNRFGALINAFKYGAPPHAGCAFGVDRMFMVLVSEDNVREVVAFPKNGSGIDHMMGSPRHVDPEQLKELSL